MEAQIQFPRLFLTSQGICTSKRFGFALRPEATKCLNTMGNKENTVCSVQRVTFPYYQTIIIKKKKKVTGKVLAESRLLEVIQGVLNAGLL